MRHMIGLSAVLWLFAVPAAHADAISDFYKGRTVEIVVGSDAGGGYDLVARTLGAFIGRHIPGGPEVVVKNMPGAGSRRAAAFIHASAPKDGATIGAIFPGAIMEAALKGPETVRYDPNAYQYLGSPELGTNLCFVMATAPVKTLADTRSHEVILGASQSGGSTRDFALFLAGMFGAKVKLVAGYPGSRQILLAVERGEVQGVCGLNWSSVLAQRSDWVRDKKINLLVQFGPTHPDLEKLGVPNAASFVRTDEERQAHDFMVSQLSFARPYMLPPGTPSDRVAALRAAFDKTMADPDFRATAKRAKLEIDPVPGAKLQDIVAKVFASPKPVVERVAKILEGK